MGEKEKDLNFATPDGGSFQRAVRSPFSMFSAVIVAGIRKPRGGSNLGDLDYLLTTVSLHL